MRGAAAYGSRSVSWVKRIAVALGVVLVVLAGIVVWRAVNVRSRQVDVAPAPPLAVDASHAAAGLAEAVRFATVSHQNPAEFDPVPFIGLRHFLEARFPRVHAALRRETVNEYSLLYTWPGSGAGASRSCCSPISTSCRSSPAPRRLGAAAVLAAPSPTATSGAAARSTTRAARWRSSRPSSCCWPRACSRRAPCTSPSATTRRSAATAAPRRSPALLRERGVAPELRARRGRRDPRRAGAAASPRRWRSIGMAEKGYVSVELTVHGAGGHSSMPPRHTAIGVLSAAVARARAPARCRATSTRRCGRQLRVPRSGDAVRAAPGARQPVAVRPAGRVADGRQRRRPTRPSAPPPPSTMFQGGVKENELPSSARAVVNFRILPGDTVDERGRARAPHRRRPAGRGARARRRRATRRRSPTLEAPAFARFGPHRPRDLPGHGGHAVPGPRRHRRPPLHRAQPATSTASCPSRLAADDLARIHGTNERIAVDDYAGMIRFYVELLR